MSQDRVVELRDTNIRIEIELVKQPVPPEPAPQSDRGWPIDSPSKDKLFPYTPIMKVYVGDQQIGLISKLSVQADMENVLPLIEISLAGGMDGETFEALTPETKETLAKAAGLLRQFPFVQVNVPMVPVV